MADDDRYELVVDVFEGRNFPKIGEGKGIVVQAVVNDAVRAKLRLGHPGAPRTALCPACCATTVTAFTI